MKRAVFFLFLLFLSGCATTTNYTVDVSDYTRQLPSYPLKLTVYYKPNIEGNQLLENEFTQIGTEKTGYFRILTGSFIVKKFDSASGKMFSNTERVYESDLPSRLLLIKTKNADLLCDVQLVSNSFKFDKKEGFTETLVKNIITGPFPRKTEYYARTDLEFRVAFYTSEGSVLLENTYPYTTTEPLYLCLTGDIVKPLLDKSNEQFGEGVDEFISKVVYDLSNSEKFKEIVSSKELMN